MTGPLLSLHAATVRYAVAGGWRSRSIAALAPTTLDVQRGELLAVVGESGSGKSTLGRAMLRLLPLAGGTVRFDGADITGLGRAALSALRPRMQMIFQDPYSSLNPNKTVGRTLTEVLAHVGVSPGDRRARAEALLGQVGLDASAYTRLPRAFSGGQRQRIAIARTLATDPELIVADEPVSALDVSVRAQVVNLLLDLKAQRGLTMVLISHDLGLVTAIAQRVCVMYFGRIVEIGAADQFAARPAHPCTATLNDSMPQPEVAAARATLSAASRAGVADLPSLLNPPAGCAFRPRCPRATDLCARETPTLLPHAFCGLAACHHPLPGPL